MSKIVIALGGNALGNDPKEQAAIVKITAKTIVDVVEKKNDVVVVHGNGPQVGMISLAFDEARKVNSKIPVLPLSLAVAMSQGYIGLHLQQAIDNEFQSRRGLKNRKAYSLVSQVVVDKSDPSFNNPTKPIGLFYTKEEALEIAELKKDWVIREDSGRGYRRVVPSPKPIDILEKKLILEIIKDGNVVIAGGGGGIPTTFNDQDVNDVIDAVVDKDYTAEKIAEIINADVLMIITAVDGIFFDFGKPNERRLVNPTAKELEKYLNDGIFPEGSMGPKVRAAINFVNSKSGRSSCITDLNLAKEALKGNAGTWIKE